MQYEEFGADIEVSRFIIRKDEIAFDLIDRYLGDNWRFTGIAKLREDGSYSAGNLSANAVVGGCALSDLESIPVSVRFVVEAPIGPKIKVSGTWFVEGEVQKFSGTLRRFT